MNTIKLAAITYYTVQRQVGKSPTVSAQKTWEYLRRYYLRKARAPSYCEKLSINSSKRKAYRSPLGDVFGITGEFGHCAATWPRTQRSHEESNQANVQLLSYLESHRDAETFHALLESLPTPEIRRIFSKAA